MASSSCSDLEAAISRLSSSAKQIQELQVCCVFFLVSFLVDVCFIQTCSTRSKEEANLLNVRIGQSRAWFDDVDTCLIEVRCLVSRIINTGVSKPLIATYISLLHDEKEAFAKLIDPNLTNGLASVCFIFSFFFLLPILLVWFFGFEQVEMAKQPKGKRALIEIRMAMAVLLSATTICYTSLGIGLGVLGAGTEQGLQDYKDYQLRSSCDDLVLASNKTIFADSVSRSALKMTVDLRDRFPKDACLSWLEMRDCVSCGNALDLTDLQLLVEKINAIRAQTQEIKKVMQSMPKFAPTTCVIL